MAFSNKNFYNSSNINFVPQLNLTIITIIFDTTIIIIIIISTWDQILSIPQKINNDTAIEIPQYKKYYGNNNFYNKQVGVGDEFGPKTFTGKFSLSNKEQFRVKKYNYEYHKNPKNEDGEKKRFFNSKMDNSKENLKDLDSKGDLFLEKYKKAISNEHMAFGFSSSENSTPPKLKIIMM